MNKMIRRSQVSSACASIRFSYTICLVLNERTPTWDAHKSKWSNTHRFIYSTPYWWLKLTISWASAEKTVHKRCLPINDWKRSMGNVSILSSANIVFAAVYRFVDFVYSVEFYILLLVQFANSFVAFRSETFHIRVTIHLLTKCTSRIRIQ